MSDKALAVDVMKWINGDRDGLTGLFTTLSQAWVFRSEPPRLTWVADFSGTGHIAGAKSHEPGYGTIAGIVSG